MTGPENYQRAEAIVAALEDSTDIENAKVSVAAAQVHATLALAAATALTQDATLSSYGPTVTAWKKVAGPGMVIVNDPA